MDDQQSTKCNKRPKIVNTGEQVVKSTQHQKEFCFEWNRAALDAKAKEFSLLLFEDEHIKEGIQGYLSAINKLKRKSELLNRKLQRLKSAINFCCATAKKGHEKVHYESFLKQRNVGTQFPPKYILVSHSQKGNVSQPFFKILRS